MERAYGSDPWDAASHPPAESDENLDPELVDTDGDMLPDLWETRHGFNPASAAGAGETRQDPDQDGLVNIREFFLTTNPINADTDGDGMKDGWEVEHAFNPLNPADGAPGQDADGDTLANVLESQLGTAPRRADTDGDGMPDAWEVEHAHNPNSFEDRFSDVDQDGWVAWREFVNGTNPQVADPGGPALAGGGQPSQGRIVAYARHRTAKALAAKKQASGKVVTSWIFQDWNELKFQGNLSEAKVLTK